ncbi:uncharacterized protein METZ01_LOCUS386269 [marine metagenome]|uniref:Uncharacterized protein n=1 Tax=marine metagenome TaxID=408172 RepID=A0A382UHW6_9ZZZZ
MNHIPTQEMDEPTPPVILDTNETDDSPMGRTYLAVLILEIIVLACLWFLSRYFSS